MKADLSTISALESSTEDESYWQRHFESYKRSGKTRANYCRINNVNYDRFRYWNRKNLPKPSSLIAVKLKPIIQSPSQATHCTLSLSNGRTLQIHDQATLSYILEKLA